MVGCIIGETEKGGRKEEKCIVERRKTELKNEEGRGKKVMAIGTC